MLNSTDKFQFLNPRKNKLHPKIFWSLGDGDRKETLKSVSAIPLKTEKKKK